MVRKTCDNSKNGEVPVSLSPRPVLKLTEKSNLDSYIKGLIFDITTSNTGLHKGACFRIEKVLGTEMVRLACCQHDMKIVLLNVFLYLFGLTEGPSTALFK